MTTTQLMYLGRPVGKFRSDRTYITYRDKNTYFRKFKGFGMSYGLLQKLIKLRCRRIVLIYDDGETKKKYITTPNKFLDKSIIYKNNYDNQRILPTKEFGIQGKLNKFL